MDAGRFEHLWSSFLGGVTLTLAEENELAAGLADDEALRTRFFRDAQLDAALRTLGRCQRTEWRFTAGVMERIEVEEPTRLRIAHGPASTNGHASQLHSGQVQPTPHIEIPPALEELTHRRRKLPVWIAVAAAASIAVSSAILYWLNREPESRLNPLPTPTNVVKNPLPKLEPLKEVARLADAMDGEWEGLKPTGWATGRLVAGPILRLVKGQARIAFDDGATVELIGPAAFELVSADQGYLHRGRLQARVPPWAVGFRVKTPSALIVDLGTEFDVSVDDNGVTTVHVRKGQVEAFALTQEGAPGESWRLGAGATRRIEPSIRVAPPRRGFRGELIIDGELREFTDEEEYKKAEKAAREKLQSKLSPPVAPIPEEPLRPPAEEPKQPEAPGKPMAKEPEKAAEKKAGKFQGFLEINGQRTRFNSPRDFDNSLKAWEQFGAILKGFQLFRRNMMGPQERNQAGQVFRGVIVINGRRHEFADREGFEKLRGELMQPFEPPEKQPAK